MMVQRITSKDPDEMMPPPKATKRLSPAQVETLKRWVAGGAQWEPHWSFIAPQRPAVPDFGELSRAAVKNAGWVRNPIDAFILARLEQEGLAPRRGGQDDPDSPGDAGPDRPSADAGGGRRLPRRHRPDAYERVVDRLLANPHYGERMALDWLDAARYADTHGYHIDAGRDQTRWRQW